MDKEQCLKISRENAFYAPGKAEQITVEWLIDTGCTITIVSSRTFHHMKPDERPQLEPCPKRLLSADDSPIPVLGMATMNITVGTKLVQHQVIVADIADEGILGTDFFREHQVIIDFGRKKVICDGENIAARVRTSRDKCCRIVVAENTTIPAKSRTILPSKATRPLADGQWMVESLNKLPGNQPILTARTIVQTCGRDVPIEVLNPSDEDIILYKYTNIGLVSRVLEPEVLCAIDCEQSKSADGKTNGDIPMAVDEKSENGTLPVELQKLVEGFQVPLTTEEKFRIEELLLQNKAVFALSGQPLGHTDLVQHEIVTSTERPIKQAVRRPPFHLRDEADKAVDKMLQDGVIEPSHSPWASPVVLVRKKDGTLRYCID